jgi:rare lipoprotein A
MIRSAILSLTLLPALAGAATMPCGTPLLAPMPASVPTPEMLHAIPSLATCVDLASYTQRLRQPVAPTPAPTAGAPASGTAYVPKTQHDNSPWRFDMNQNGRRMTSSEFDAWMKAKGIRVATGKPGAQVPTATPVAAPVAPAAGSQ